MGERGVFSWTGHPAQASNRASNPSLPMFQAGTLAVTAPVAAGPEDTGQRRQTRSGRAARESVRPRFPGPTRSRPTTPVAHGTAAPAARPAPEAGVVPVQLVF